MNTIDRIGWLNTVYRCSDNYWCCSPGGNVTNCCNTERVFKLPSTPAQVQNGTGFVPGYTIVALGGPVPTPAGQGTPPTGVGGTSSAGVGGTTSAGEGTTSTPFAGASGTSIANSSTSQPATSQSHNVVVMALAAVLGVALLLLLPISLFLLSREKKRNKNLRAGQWNGSKSSAAVRQPRQVRDLCGVREDPGERLELEATHLRELEEKR